MDLKLGLHLGYASTRYYEPKLWTEMVRNEFGLNYVQFTSNLMEPSLPKSILSDEIQKTKYYLKKYKHKQIANRINPKVAEEMAKKITEEAAMHRKERREDNNQ